MDQNRELLREVVWEWHLYAREKSRKKIVRDRMVELAVEAINRGMINLKHCAASF